jgi:hypothetical protein
MFREAFMLANLEVNLRRVARLQPCPLPVLWTRPSAEAAKHGSGKVPNVCPDTELAIEEEQWLTPS